MSTWPWWLVISLLGLTSALGFWGGDLPQGWGFLFVTALTLGFFFSRPLRYSRAREKESQLTKRISAWREELRDRSKSSAWRMKLKTRIRAAELELEGVRSRVYRLGPHYRRHY